MGCVPSSDPKVAPCELDQAPVLPSEIAAAKKQAEAQGDHRASKKAGAHGRSGRAVTHGRGSRKGSSFGCVPSPNPDVPPCDLDESPLTPSVLKAQATTPTKSDAPKPDTSKKTSK
jgi:hypothetical protein